MTAYERYIGIIKKLSDKHDLALFARIKQENGLFQMMQKIIHWNDFGQLSQFPVLIMEK